MQALESRCNRSLLIMGKKKFRERRETLTRKMKMRQLRMMPMSYLLDWSSWDFKEILEEEGKVTTIVNRNRTKATNLVQSSSFPVPNCAYR